MRFLKRLWCRVVGHIAPPPTWRTFRSLQPSGFGPVDVPCRRCGSAAYGIRFADVRGFRVLEVEDK